MPTHFINELTIKLADQRVDESFVESDISIRDVSAVAIGNCLKRSVDHWGDLRSDLLTLPVTYYADLDVRVVDRAGCLVGSVHRRRDPDPRCREDDEHMIVEKRGSDGQLVERRRYRRQELHDGLDGQPAREVFTAAGIMTYREFYSNGVLQDGRNGEPACTNYFDDSGNVWTVERFMAGEPHDGPDGDAAHKEYAEDGSLVAEGHYHRGVRTGGRMFDGYPSDFYPGRPVAPPAGVPAQPKGPR